MLVTWCTAESTGPGTRRPSSSLGFFHSPRQTQELLSNAYEEQRSHLHGPPHGTLRIKRDALCEGSLESISKAIKSSHLIGWKEPTILKSQNQILRDKKKKKGTDGSCGSIPTSFLSFLYISKSFLNTINRRFGISTAPGLKYFYFGKKNTLRT